MRHLNTEAASLTSDAARARDSTSRLLCICALNLTMCERWFFRLHDPTTPNRQGNDVGTQYRSAIFPQTPEQRETAERVRARVQASGTWKRPITTTIEPASTWYDAESYHQDYLRKNPGGYSCHFLRD